MGVYCQYDIISKAFIPEKAKALSLFRTHAQGIPAMCFLDVAAKDPASPVYGQCTFSTTGLGLPGDRPLKFIHTIETIVQQDVMGILIPGYMVKKILFVHEHLFLTFRANPRLNKYQSRFQLVPDIVVDDPDALIADEMLRKLFGTN